MAVTGHPIKKLLNFNRFLSPGDLMHTGPLGSVSNFVGSVLSEMVFSGPFVGTTQQRLQQVWGHIVFEYDVCQSTSRLSMLALSSIMALTLFLASLAKPAIA